MIERDGSNQVNSVSQKLTQRSDWIKGTGKNNKNVGGLLSKNAA